MNNVIVGGNVYTKNNAALMMYAIMSEWMEMGGYISSQVALRLLTATAQENRRHLKKGEKKKEDELEGHPSNTSCLIPVSLTAVCTQSLHFYWSSSYLRLASEISIMMSRSASWSSFVFASAGLLFLLNLLLVDQGMSHNLNLTHPPSAA